jgi:hypothetical protein
VSKSTTGTERIKRANFEHLERATYVSVIVPHSVFFGEGIQKLYPSLFPSCLSGSSRAVLSVWREPPRVDDDASFDFGVEMEFQNCLLSSLLPSAAAAGPS